VIASGGMRLSWFGAEKKKETILVGGGRNPGAVSDVFGVNNRVLKKEEIPFSHGRKSSRSRRLT